MRLIDADALRAELDAAGAMLRDAFDLGAIDLADILAVVDAAPKLRCDNCRYWRDQFEMMGGLYGVCHRGDIVFPDADTSPAGHGCALHEVTP